MSAEGIGTTLNETTVWHELESSTVASMLDVDPAQGLSTAEAAKRLEQHGPNSLDQTKKEPTWRAFLRQYKDYMRIVLLVAAIGSAIIGDYSTGLILFLLTVASAFAGLFQERRAADSVAALRKMMNIQARVRRDGQRGRQVREPDSDRMRGSTGLQQPPRKESEQHHGESNGIQTERWPGSPAQR